MSQNVDIDKLNILKNSISKYKYNMMDDVTYIEKQVNSCLNNLSEYDEYYVRSDISRVYDYLSKLRRLKIEFENLVSCKETGLVKAADLYEQYEKEQAAIFHKNLIPKFMKFMETIGNEFKEILKIQSDKWLEDGKFGKVKKALDQYKVSLNIPDNPYKSRGVSVAIDNVFKALAHTGISFTEEEKKLFMKMTVGEQQYLIDLKDKLNNEKSIANTLTLMTLIASMYIKYKEKPIEEPLIEQELIAVNMGGIDYQALNPATQKEIQYLIEAIMTMEDEETRVDDKFALLEYTREDYEGQLERLLTNLQNPIYAGFERASAIVYRSGAGVLQTVGGFGEATIGWGIATIGSWAIITIPTGGYLMIDGASNMYEGADRFVNGVFDPGSDSVNPLRDYVFEGILGEDLGERVYNFASIGAGIICIGKTFLDLKKLGLIKTFKRPNNIAKAAEHGLATEVVVYDLGETMLIVVQEVNPSTSTPMILEKIVINTKECAKQGASIVIDLQGNSSLIQETIEEEIESGNIND